MLAKWIKEGDFQQVHPVDYDGAYSRRVAYINRNNSNQELRIFGFPNGTKQIEYCNPSDALFKECIHERQGFTSYNQKTYVAIYPTDNIAKLKELIEVINKHDSLDEIRDEVFTCLGIRKPEEELAVEVSKLTEEGEFEKAVELAKQYQQEGYFEIIWELGETLHKDPNMEPSILVNLYQAISTQNPHYKEANEKLYVLSESPKIGKQEVLQKDYFTLEKQFDLANKSDKQNLIDQGYHRLCGYDDLSPILRDVKGDTQTLIATARQLRAKNEIILNLQKEIAQLKLVNKSVETNQISNKASSGDTRSTFFSPSISTTTQTVDTTSTSSSSDVTTKTAQQDQNSSEVTKNP